MTPSYPFLLLQGEEMRRDKYRLGWVYLLSASGKATIQRKKSEKGREWERDGEKENH